jgi:hypothetical protein
MPCQQGKKENVPQSAEDRRCATVAPLICAFAPRNSTFGQKSGKLRHVFAGTARFRRDLRAIVAACGANA